MSNEEKELLKEKIKKAIQLSAQKLVASKRANGQSVVEQRWKDSGDQSLRLIFHKKSPNNVRL